MAVEAAGEPTHATDPNCKLRCLDLAAVAAWNLGQQPEALRMAEEAAAQCPDNPRLAEKARGMRRLLEVQG